CALCCAHACLVFRQRGGAERNLPAFPTRRASDLEGGDVGLAEAAGGFVEQEEAGFGGECAGECDAFAFGVGEGAGGAVGERGERSEEHTSELQSREKLVCRLLLEKNNRRPALATA